MIEHPQLPHPALDTTGLTIAEGPDRSLVLSGSVSVHGTEVPIARTFSWADGIRIGFTVDGQPTDQPAQMFGLIAYYDGMAWHRVKHVTPAPAPEPETSEG